MSRAAQQHEADYVIVGTGAGGATAARVLSGAGRSVLMIEEGPYLRAADRPRDIAATMHQSFRDNGTLTTLGRAPFPLLQGRLVGGSTAINSGIIWRMPEDVRRVFAGDFGLGELVDARGLDDTFSQIERELAIMETPAEVRGRNATRMAQACEALGLPGRVIARNVRGCAGSARCLQGCPRDARTSMDVSYVPFALSHGGVLWELARAERVQARAGRAAFVCGSLLDRETLRVRGRFRAHGRRGIILAASALQTPLLLWRSGLRRMVGERFQAHPGCAVVGFFDEPIVQGFGATQSYEVPCRERGYKLESLSMPPELLAARLPGVGAAWQQRLSRLGHAAHWVAQVRMGAMGRVRPGWGGRPLVRYEPLARDMEKVRESLCLLVQMFFAAGAREVSHGVHGLDPIFTRPEQVAQLSGAPLDPRRLHLLASHLFGTACAGADPNRSVVDPALECHALKGLYVMDASVFPTNMGVNPQHSIMALAWRAAARLT